LPFQYPAEGGEAGTGDLQRKVGGQEQAAADGVRYGADLHRGAGRHDVGRADPGGVLVAVKGPFHALEDVFQGGEGGVNALLLGVHGKKILPQGRGHRRGGSWNAGEQNGPDDGCPRCPDMVTPAKGPKFTKKHDQKEKGKDDGGLGDGGFAGERPA